MWSCDKCDSYRTCGVFVAKWMFAWLCVNTVFVAGFSCLWLLNTIPPTTQQCQRFYPDVMLLMCGRGFLKAEC